MSKLDEILKDVITNGGSYGGEDKGSEYYHVWKFTMENEVSYVRSDGTYASHYGTDFDGWGFVTPREKTVIVYE